MTSNELKKILEDMIEEIKGHLTMTQHMDIGSDSKHSSQEKLSNIRINYIEYEGFEIDISLQDEKKIIWNILKRWTEKGIEIKLTRMQRDEKRQEIKCEEDREVQDKELKIVMEIRELIDHMIEQIKLEKEERSKTEKACENKGMEIGD